MGWDCLVYKSYWLRDNFLLAVRSDHTTGSRNIQEAQLLLGVADRAAP